MNPYGIETSESAIQGPVISLNILYDEMPETTGCEKCHEVNGDDAFWCCRTLSPSMYYIEFLNVWKEVQGWDKEKRAALVVRSIKNHLLGGNQKGCVFWTGECSVYEKRPYSCRMYGVVPKESWDARVESLKKQYGEDFDPRPQCNLVSVVGDEITKEKDDKWFRHTKQCEKRIGIPPNIVEAHDDPQGSYRTFHDHILLELFEEDFLTQLSRLRLTNPSTDEIDEFVKALEVQLRQNGII